MSGRIGITWWWSKGRRCRSDCGGVGSSSSSRSASTSNTTTNQSMVRRSLDGYCSTTGARTQPAMSLSTTLYSAPQFKARRRSSPNYVKLWIAESSGSSGTVAKIIGGGCREPEVVGYGSEGRKDLAHSWLGGGANIVGRRAKWEYESEYLLLLMMTWRRMKKMA